MTTLTGFLTQQPLLALFLEHERIGSGEAWGISTSRTCSRSSSRRKAVRWLSAQIPTPMVPSASASAARERPTSEGFAGCTERASGVFATKPAGAP